MCQSEPADLSKSPGTPAVCRNPCRKNCGTRWRLWGVIDAHLHLWNLDAFVTGGVRPYSWLGPQHGALFRSFGEDEAGGGLAEAGIRGAVLVQADDTVADTESMLGVAARNPWVLGVVGWIQLDSTTQAAEQLDAFAAHSVFRGV